MAACGWPHDTRKVPARVITLTAKDAGTRCAAIVGDEIEVTLEEKPTTGFVWTCAVDAGALRLVGDDATPAGPAMGAGRLHSFRFSAAGAGRTTLVLRKVRSWEPDKIAEEFSVEVDIAEA